MPLKIYKNEKRVWLNKYKRRHRDNGPAVEYPDGSKFWYKNGTRHKEDGPAIILSNGDKYWMVHGRLDREDGPAIEYGDGTKEYWIWGIRYDTEEEYNKEINDLKQIRYKPNLHFS